MNNKAMRWIESDGLIPSCIVVKIMSKSIEKGAQKDFKYLGFKDLKSRISVSIIEFINLGCFPNKEEK
jgi:hypothetical protein